MTTKTRSEIQVVRQESSHAKYFHMMLNMADDDLNAHEYRLLGHYLRWAGHGGSHQESVRQTAKVTRMGKATVDKVREDLAAKGYIQVIKPTKEQQKDGVATQVIVLDRWHENISRYSKDVLNQIWGVSSNKDTGVSIQVGGGVLNQVDSEEQGLEERLEELNTSTAPIGTDELSNFVKVDAFKSFIETDEFPALDLKEESPAVTNQTPPPSSAQPPAPKKERKSKYSPEENKAIDALFAAWYTTAEIVGRPGLCNNPTVRAGVMDMHKRGVVPEMVELYVQHLRSTSFQNGKAIPWYAITGGIIPWLKSRNKLHQSELTTAPAPVLSQKEQDARSAALQAQLRMHEERYGKQKILTTNPFNKDGVK